MNIPLRSIRRATLDDLPALHSLWKLENLPSADLDKRFKEFQVAESEEGELLGAVGVQVAGHEARLHSEVFVHFDQAEELRRRFWERIRTMAENQGWVRLWTQLTGQAWRECGFDPPAEEQMAKLPETFSNAGHGHWFMVQLKEEKVGAPSLDAEFELLRMAHLAEQEQIARRAKVLRTIAAMLVTGVVLFSTYWLVKLLRNKDRIQKP